MNIMLLFLSEYKNGAVEALYQSDLANIKIMGTQTSYAPTRYLLQYVKLNKSENVDKILCITSKLLKENGLEQYKEMVAEYCCNNDLYQPEIVSIAYDFDPDEANLEREYELSDKVNQLYQGIVEEVTKIIPKDEQIHLYVDYTGGLRDVNLFMIVLIRYLEFMQMKCEKVIYSNLYEKKIVSLDYVYQLFHVINGISEFIRSGSSALLQETVLSNEEMAQKYPQIKKLLDTMQEFSNMITLCVVDNNIEKVLQQLRESIDAVQRMDVSESDETEIAISMLKNLLKEIQEKLLLDQSQQLSYLQIIKWCLGNNMLQQAITFYIEKVPKIYYENKLINWIETEENGEVPEHDEYSKQFYTTLYDNIKKTSGVNTYQKKLNSICALSTEGNSFGSISNSDLKEILEYYLVLKVIRNQINHANEEESEGIKAVEKYLTENRKGYSTFIEVNNIKTILNKAVSKTEELIKYTKIEN